MAVNVVFMGSLAEATFTRSIKVHHCDDIHSLHRYLEEQFPDLKKQSFKILHNNEVLNKEGLLEDGDEVVLLPPHNGT